MAVPKKKTSVSKSKKRRAGNRKSEKKLGVQKNLISNLSNYMKRRKSVLKKKYVKQNNCLYTNIINR